MDVLSEMEEFFQFRCAFGNCACEDFFESFEFQEGPVRPRDFESAVAEEEQPRRADESALLAFVGGDRQQTHRKTIARQRFRFAALFSGTAHQNCLVGKVPQLDLVNVAQP